MNETMHEISHSQPFEVRFSEVDSMGIAWHGSYALYFEDAREGFGKRYGLDYLTIYHNGYYAPLVELEFKYHKPLIYGAQPVATITYHPTDAAKIVFTYTITDSRDGSVLCTGRSVQVFMDLNYQLVWSSPDFYEAWKEKMCHDC